MKVVLTSNGAEAAGAGAAVTDTVAVGAEAPVALGAIGIRVGDRTGVLGVIDVAKVVNTGGVVLQLHGEKGRVQLGLDGVEEGGLRLGLDCVSVSR